jgi:hypothetical protein
MKYAGCMYENFLTRKKCRADTVIMQRYKSQDKRDSGTEYMNRYIYENVKPKTRK